MPSNGPLYLPGLTDTSPYTFEGAMELRRAVNRNIADARGCRGAVAKALWFPAPILAALVLPRVWQRFKQWWNGA